MNSVAFYYLLSISALAIIFLVAFVFSATFDNALETCRKKYDVYECKIIAVPVERKM